MEEVSSSRWILLEKSHMRTSLAEENRNYEQTTDQKLRQKFALDLHKNLKMRLRCCKYGPIKPRMKMDGYKFHTFSGIGGGWPSESLLFSLSFLFILPGSISVSPSSSVPADFKEL